MVSAKWDSKLIVAVLNLITFVTLDLLILDQHWNHLDHHRRGHTFC